MCLENIVDMEKRGSLKPDIHESRLHAGKHPDDAAKINISGQSPGLRPLDVQFLRSAFGNDGYSGFLRGNVDKDIFSHGMDIPAFLKSTVVSYKGKPMIPE